MERRKLGLTDIDVSVLCLGTMTYGTQNTPAEAFEQMDYSLSEGINFFDTAELYAIPPSAETYGRSEEIIGDWFQKTGKRKDIVLATKASGPGGFSWIRGGNIRHDRAQITEAVEGSLKRLKTDYIDLYQIHWPQRAVNSFGKMDYDQTSVSGRETDVILEILEVTHDLIKAGKIRALGLSNETPWGVMTYLKHHVAKSFPRVVSIQNPYSLLNRTFEIGLSEIALQEKVGLLAYSPLGGGTLTGKYLNGQVPKGSRWDIDARTSRYKRPRLDETVTAYVGIAKKHGLDAAQMALAFVNQQAFLTSNIFGATKMDQLKNNVASARLKLSADVVQEINAVHRVTPNPCP